MQYCEVTIDQAGIQERWSPKFRTQTSPSHPINWSKSPKESPQTGKKTCSSAGNDIMPLSETCRSFGYGVEITWESGVALKELSRSGFAEPLTAPSLDSHGEGWDRLQERGISLGRPPQCRSVNSSQPSRQRSIRAKALARASVYWEAIWEQLGAFIFYLHLWCQEGNKMLPTTNISVRTCRSFKIRTIVPWWCSG